MKQLVQEWIQKKEMKHLLIYILLKDVTTDMTLSQVISKCLLIESEKYFNDIGKIISDYGCLLLLDGLDELSMTAKDKSYLNVDDFVCDENKGRFLTSLTLGEILQGSLRIRDLNIRIWVTSREIDYAKNHFPLPYIKVQMNGFSKKQAQDYIEKSCQFYIQSRIPTLKKRGTTETADGTNRSVSWKHSLVNEWSVSSNLTQRNNTDELHKEQNIEATNDSDEIKQENNGVKEDDMTTKRGMRVELKEEMHEAGSNVAKKTNEEKYSDKADRKDKQGKNINTRGINTEESIKINVQKEALRVQTFLENNDVFSSFQKIPLLFIMMVHIMSAKYTSSVSYLEGIKIDKLTLLIRTVLSCLESRYCQKRNISMSEEIIDLETTLGMIALKKKFQLTVMGYTMLAKEGVNVKLALEVGILRQSKKTGANNEMAQNLSFSSFTGVEFFDNLFQAYLAAKVVVDDPKHLKNLFKIVAKTKEEDSFRVLQFVCGLEESLCKTICEELRGMKKYNNLIDCLHEINNEDVIQNALKKLQKDTLNIAYFERKYHRDALTVFCQHCKQLNIQLSRLVFHKDCDIAFLKTMELPIVGSVHFFQKDVAESDFVSILQWISKHDFMISIVFVDCQTPNQLSQNSKALVKTFEKSNIKVFKKRIDGKTEAFFNCSTGEWTSDVKHVLKENLKYIIHFN
ncbi:hypothetical protein HOLleu_44524 [Holothuria leucospilota]|uniref:NACHT domain-containing protein n=1 Tax=Holothuria leucospilota TaxID=206669 RepID=A0A9Q1B9B8_HOLLE|nr:hypothetical protein HOLleu_44524 [Holothuria leucospilota]